MRLPFPVLSAGFLFLLGGAVVIAAPPAPMPDTADTADTADSALDDTGDTDLPIDTDTGLPDDTDTDTDTDIDTDTPDSEAEDSSVYSGAAKLAGETGGVGCTSSPAPAALGVGFWLLGLAVMRRRV